MIVETDVETREQPAGESTTRLPDDLLLPLDILADSAQLPDAYVEHWQVPFGGE